MPSLLSIGSSALNAANAGLRTTGQNIANVNTPGYSRQITMQASAVPQFTGAGYMGNGVDVTTVRRMYDGFLTAQATQAAASSAEASSRAGQLDYIVATLGKTDGGMSAALNNLFGAINAANNNPTDISARQSALSAAASLAAQFNNAAASLADQRRAVESQMRSSVSMVNQQLKDMASLNQQIALAQGSGQPPNDLLDKRDALVRSISGLIGVTAIPQDNGMVNLFIGNGQAVVVGTNASALELRPSSYDLQRPVFGVTTGGSFTAIDSSQLSGGSLSGALKFADQDLAQAQDEIGRLALVTASALNAQHRAGVDAQGTAGGDLFAVPPPTSSASNANQGGGAIDATITDATALKASPYRIDYDGSQYTVTRVSDGASASYASLPQTVDGLQLSMSGSPQKGDSFTVNAVRAVPASIAVAITSPRAVALGQPGSGIGDNRNGLALSDVANQALVDGLTLSDTMAGLFGKFGALNASAHATADAQAAVLSSANGAEQSVTGVNLDEEAARLLQYQQAYQAAAKVISTAQNVFNTLLEIGR